MQPSNRNGRLPPNGSSNVNNFSITEADDLVLNDTVSTVYDSPPISSAKSRSLSQQRLMASALAGNNELRVSADCNATSFVEEELSAEVFKSLEFENGDTGQQLAAMNEEMTPDQIFRRRSTVSMPEGALAGRPHMSGSGALPNHGEERSRSSAGRSDHTISPMLVNRSGSSSQERVRSRYPDPMEESEVVDEVDIKIFTYRVLREVVLASARYCFSCLLRHAKQRQEAKRTVSPAKATKVSKPPRDSPAASRSPRKVSGELPHVTQSPSPIIEEVEEPVIQKPSTAPRAGNSPPPPALTQTTKASASPNPSVKQQPTPSLPEPRRVKKLTDPPPASARQPSTTTTAIKRRQTPDKPGRKGRADVTKSPHRAPKQKGSHSAPPASDPSAPENRRGEVAPPPKLRVPMRRPSRPPSNESPSLPPIAGAPSPNPTRNPPKAKPSPTPSRSPSRSPSRRASPTAIDEQEVPEDDPSMKPPANNKFRHKYEDAEARKNFFVVDTKNRYNRRADNGKKKFEDKSSKLW